MYWKLNHSNIITLSGEVSSLFCCDVVATSVDNLIPGIQIRSKQQ